MVFTYIFDARITDDLQTTRTSAVETGFGANKFYLVLWGGRSQQNSSLSLSKRRVPFRWGDAYRRREVFAIGAEPIQVQERICAEPLHAVVGQTLSANMQRYGCVYN